MAKPLYTLLLRTVNDVGESEISTVRLISRLLALHQGLRAVPSTSSHPTDSWQYLFLALLHLLSKTSSPLVKAEIANCLRESMCREKDETQWILLASVLYPWGYNEACRFQQFFDDSRLSGAVAELMKSVGEVLSHSSNSAASDNKPVSSDKPLKLLREVVSPSHADPSRYHSAIIQAFAMGSEYPADLVATVSFASCMLPRGGASEKLQLLYLSVLARNVKRISVPGIEQLVPLARAAFASCKSLSVTQRLFETLFAFTKNSQECYSMVKDLLARMITVRSSFEAKILGAKLHTEFALRSGIMEEVANLQRVYKNVLSLLPGSLMAERTVLLEVERLARSRFGESVPQYFFGFLLRNLGAGKSKEEVLRSAWTVRLLGVLIKERLLTFEVTYNAISGARFVQFYSRVKSLLQNVGDTELSSEETLLLTNVVSLYAGFTETIAGAKTLISKLSQPELKEEQRAEITSLIRDKSAKVLEYVRLLETVVSRAKSPALASKAAKTLGKLLDFVYAYGLEYTTPIPATATYLEVRQLQREAVLKEKTRVYEIVMGAAKKSKELRLDVMLGVTMNFELSQLADEAWRRDFVPVDDAKSLAGKTPTFVKKDYENVYARVIADYMAERSEASAVLLLTAATHINRAQIPKLPSLVFCLHATLESCNSAVAVSSALSFLDKFCTCTNELMSYSSAIVSSKTLCAAAARFDPERLADLRSALVTELVAKYGNKHISLAKRTETILFEIAAELPVPETATKLLRKLRRFMEVLGENKAISLETRREVAKTVRNDSVKRAREYLIKKGKEIKTTLKEKKVGREWLRMVFEVLRLASRQYATK